MSLFGYFYLGLQSMNAARLGLQVSGNNISNATTPGYARRRVELTPGFPIRVPGGLLDSGVDVAGIRRMEDLFLQASLEREQSKQAGSEELLRGLGQIESTFGTLESDGGIGAALARFSAAFDELAAQPDDLALRRGAISAADGVARVFRETYARLEDQRRFEDRAVTATVERVNTLADEMAKLNREIHAEEAAGGVAAPLRDQRGLVIEELTDLTGGTAVTASDGRVSFSFAGGPTLVAGDTALPLATTRAADGTLRVQAGADGREITDGLREGRLGALLYLRDEELVGRLGDLDAMTADFITRTNALTTGAIDLRGNPGVALFEPDPPGASGSAGQIQVNAAVLQDPALLAVSASGAPGDGDVALLLAALPDDPSVALGDASTNAYLADMLGTLGNSIVQADVSYNVATSLVQSLQVQRDAVSGVSLDEEAVELIKNQRAFEAAARFMQVLNEVTEVAVNLVS